jgi:parallel beta-helix repeat protein
MLVASGLQKYTRNNTIIILITLLFCILCTLPQTLATTECSIDADCDDANSCTIDICDQTNICTTTPLEDILCTDTIAPISTVIATSNDVEYIFGAKSNTPVVIAFSCQDDGAGCELTNDPYNNNAPYHCIDQTNTCNPTAADESITIENTGLWYIRYFSRDKAGNNESIRSVQVGLGNICGGTYGNCDCTDTVVGNINLTQNLYCEGEGLQITHNDVTLDCSNNALIGQSTGTGIYATGVSNLTIKNCKVYNFSKGINTVAIHTLDLEHNLIQYAYSYAAGAITLDDVYGGTIKHNTLYNNANAITIIGGENNTIRNNNLYDNQIHGIQLFETVTRIENNDLSNNAENAIYIDYYSTAHLLNNNLTGNNYNAEITNTERVAIYDEGYSYGEMLQWYLTRTINCQDNNILGLGWILPVGGGIKKNNCAIKLRGEFTLRAIEFSATQQGYKEYEYETTDGPTTIGSPSDFFEDNLTTDTTEAGHLIVTVYDTNPTNTTNNLTGLKWFKISSDASSENIYHHNLKLYFTTQELTEQNLDETTIVIQYYDATLNSWILAENNTINTTEHYVTGLYQGIDSYVGIYAQSAPICGNGVIERAEVCDSGSSNGICPATCSSSCTKNSCNSGSSRGRGGGGLSGSCAPGYEKINDVCTKIKPITTQSSQTTPTTTKQESNNTPQQTTTDTPSKEISKETTTNNNAQGTDQQVQKLEEPNILQDNDLLTGAVVGGAKSNEQGILIILGVLVFAAMTIYLTRRIAQQNRQA